MRKYNGHGSCEIDTSVINLTISQSKSAEIFAYSCSVPYPPHFMQQQKECCSYTKRIFLFWYKDGFYDIYILSEQMKTVKINIPSFPLSYLNGAFKHIALISPKIYFLFIFLQKEL